ncbi:PilZ domain-containing protein [Roseomonas aeriglobus]|nr:PilZ domain-containing protein [Roseomonas aeriglobus]
MATAYRPVTAERAVVRRRTAQVSTADAASVAGELMEISAYGCRVVMPVDPSIGGAIELSLDGAAPVGAQVVWNRAGVLACRFDAPMSRAQLRALTIQDN